MKFINFIKEFLIEKEEEYDAIIGDVDMGFTLGFCPDWKITDYCMEKYGDLLNSECKYYPEDKTHYNYVEVDFPDYKKGKAFCASVAGYIGCKEFDKLFGTHDAELAF